MKKLFFLTALISLMGIGQAQIEGLGAKAGIDIPDGGKQFFLGGSYEYKFTDQIAVEGNVLLTYYSNKIVNNGVDTKQRQLGLSIPVFAKYYFMDNFDVQLGLQADLGLMSKYKVNGHDDDSDAESYIGLTTGAEYFLTDNVNVFARYVLKSEMSYLRIGLGYTF